MSKIGKPFRFAVAGDEVEQGPAVLASSNLYIITPKPGNDPYFLKAFFESEDGERTLDQISVGTAMQNIGARSLAVVKVPKETPEAQERFGLEYKKLLESTSMRAAQARTIAERARRETAKYVIVCGDFNDTPLSYAHSVFNRFMYDAYAKSGVGMGITYHEHNLYYRIDHILCSRNITPLHTRVDRAQKDSDHYPVISRLRLQ